jgi:drug/metabolite transporter (DMT)-like permease
MASSRAIRIAPERARQALASPYLSLTATTLIWGSLHPLGKLVMRDVSPIQLILARVVFGTLILGAILATRGKVGLIGEELRTRPGRMALLAACSFLGSSGSSMIALSLLPASVSSLLSNTSPLFVALGLIAVNRGRTRADALLGVLVGFVGLAVVVFGENPNGFGELALNPVGVALSIGGSAVWAAYIGLSRQTMATGNPLAVVAASGLIAMVPWLAVAGIGGDLAHLGRLTASDWELLLYLGMVGTGVTYALWTAALRHLSATSVAVFQYGIPLSAVILSVLLLGEHVTLALVLGGVGIVAGIGLTQRSQRRASRPAPAVAASSRT